MKRIIAICLLAFVCLGAAACGHKQPEEQPALEMQVTETQQQSDSTAACETETEPVYQNIDLIGPWHPDDRRNDLSTYADLFPGYAEWGASMEILSNGQISWYIGAAGGCGTYTVEGNLLHAQLTSDADQTDMPMDFRILTENEEIMLEMSYQDMTVFWVID